MSKINDNVNFAAGEKLKTELLEKIHSAENPFTILYHIAKRLGEDTAEPGYGKYVSDQLRAVYGFALKEAQPLKDELTEVTARLSRIEAAYTRPEFTDEEKERIRFAIDLHKKNMDRLQKLIREAEEQKEE